ncbi:MAG: 1-acyl-sn-glycerol-3-phosphate acyltransferase [Firmicutes bacterium]|nr:1-acyl-sn-glycerol-3-phosphate acyltransferase [Bacillota bacterium]
MYKFCRVVVVTFLRIMFNYKIYGAENIPKEGGAVIAPNHRSYFDVPFIGITAPRPIRYMAKEELFKNPLFAALIKALGAFPVKRGGGDTGAVKTAVSILKGGDMLMIFPQGRRVKDGERGKAKPGAVMIAAAANADIIPVHISGKYKFRGKITIRVGKPMSLAEYYGKKLPSDKLGELSDELLDRIYSLEEDNNI